ncbi:MAG: hypothetical protein ABH832_01175 [bacterium]
MGIDTPNPFDTQRPTDIKNADHRMAKGQIETKITIKTPFVASLEVFYRKFSEMQSDSKFNKDQNIAEDENKKILDGIELEELARAIRDEIVKWFEDGEGMKFYAKLDDITEEEHLRAITEAMKIAPERVDIPEIDHAVRKKRIDLWANKEKENRAPEPDSSDYFDNLRIDFNEINDLQELDNLIKEPTYSRESQIIRLMAIDRQQNLTEADSFLADFKKRAASKEGIVSSGKTEKKRYESSKIDGMISKMKIRLEQTDGNDMTIDEEKKGEYYKSMLSYLENQDLAYEELRFIPTSGNDNFRHTFMELMKNRLRNRLSKSPQ